MNAPLLEFVGLEKSFFGVKVLKNLSFSVATGSVLGLVGENGAGKSTLMNLLGGNLRPDGGSIRLEGRPFAPHNPQEAARRGIAFIHQELNLFPNLTISENLFLTKFPRRSGTPFIDRNAIQQRSQDLLSEVGLAISPLRLVQTLSAGERQLVEIAKALSIEAKVIIFDEPTTSLSEPERERLFALIARLQTRGITMIYISHALGDVFKLCDQIVVLRDGEVVGAGPADTFTNESLVSLMVGRKLNQLFPERAPIPPEASKSRNAAILEVRSLSGDCTTNVSLSLFPGEVLGLAGLMGAGRSELARLLFGLDPRAGGEVRLAGESVNHLSTRELIRRGVAFLTENRRSEGLCINASVADNLALASLPRHARAGLGWLDHQSWQAAIRRIREIVRLDPKTGDAQPVRTLSGGNQQKVVLGKWLLREPRVILLDEPTRGIDVGAKFEIYRLIHQLADGGAGILVISSEMEELMGLCDRILVMRQGSLVDELKRPEFSRERILRAALGTEEA